MAGNVVFQASLIPPFLESHFSGTPPEIEEGDEGIRNMPFIIQSSRAFDHDVYFDYETQDREGEDAAEAGVDYEAVSGTAKLPRGETEVVINVPIIGDTEVEPDELFDLVLSNFRQV